MCLVSRKAAQHDGARVLGREWDEPLEGGRTEPSELDSEMKITWECSVCHHRQQREHAKQPYPADFFEGGREVRLSMICKGGCRRAPVSQLERDVLAGRVTPGYLVYIGEKDDRLPRTTKHVLVIAD